MNTDDRIRAAFEDLARQAAEADPGPGVAAFASPARSRPPRSWLGAVAAGVVIVVAVGAIALLQLGDDPVAPAGLQTTTTATTEPGPVSTPALAVTDTTTAGAATPEPVPATSGRPALILADQAGIVAVDRDRRTSQLSNRPAEVAYTDGQGGVVYQDPAGRIAYITAAGDEVELNATGGLQGVIGAAAGPAAVVIERSPIADTEAFDGRVVAVDLASNIPTVLSLRGDVVRYSTWGDSVVLTTAAEEATSLSVVRAGAEAFSVDEPSGAVIQGGIIVPSESSDAQIAYFRNDLAANTAQLVVRDLQGEVVDEYDIEGGIGMWLDADRGTLVATFGDGRETIGFALIDLATGDQQQPPFPGTATLLTGPIPVGSVAPVAENVRWRITGLDEGAFLNVRAGGGIEHERIGRLFMDDETVEVTGEGALNPDGSGWYQVRLEDGTVGFASNEFLAPPAAWEVGFNEVACGQGVSTAQVTPPPPPDGTVGSAIGGWAHVSGDQCDRYVVAFSMAGPGDGRMMPADHVPGGLSMGADPSRISVTMPDVTEVEAVATHALLGETFALIAQPADLSAPLEIRLLRGDGANARMSVLSHPARLLIDVPKTAAPPTGQTPVIGEGATLFESPVDPDGAGVSAPVTVTGYARWFEAQGEAEMRDLAGGPAPATITGPSLSGAGPGVPGSAGVYAAWNPTWGEFVLTIDAPPGDYELFVGEDCLVDDANDVWKPCGITERFTITD